MKPLLLVILALLTGAGTKAKAEGENPIETIQDKTYGINAVSDYIKETVVGIYRAPFASYPLYPNEQVFPPCMRNRDGHITCDPVPISLFGDNLQVSVLNQEQSPLTPWLILCATLGVSISDMLRLIEYRYQYSENSLYVADNLYELLLGHWITHAVGKWLKHCPFSSKRSDSVVFILLIMLKWALVGGVGGVSASLICYHLMQSSQAVSVVVRMAHD